MGLYMCGDMDLLAVIRLRLFECFEILLASGFDVVEWDLDEAVLDLVSNFYCLSGDGLGKVRVEIPCLNRGIGDSRLPLFLSFPTWLSSNS